MAGECSAVDAGGHWQLLLPEKGCLSGKKLLSGVRIWQTMDHNAAVWEKLTIVYMCLLSIHVMQQLHTCHYSLDV